MRDERAPEFYREDVLLSLRHSAGRSRLDLGGDEQAAVPPALRNLTYEYDWPELTAFAGIPGFMTFAYGCGLSDWLAGLPVNKRKSDYTVGKLCEVIIAGLAAGLARVSHVDDYRHDPGLCAALGLAQLPDQSTFSRFFAGLGEGAVRHLREANQSFSRLSTMLKQRRRLLVVDSDTRVVGVYGKLEGSKRSRLNGGKPHFTFEITAVRNSHDIVDGGLLEGATHPAPLFQSRFQTVLGQLAAQTDELIWCADSAWYSAQILETIEAADVNQSVPCTCHYVIRAKMTQRLRECVAALPEAAWQACDEGMQMAECPFAFIETRGGKDLSPRRYIVTREWQQPKPAKGGQQVLVELPSYEYWALVTNLNWRPQRVRALYNDRVTIESILCEGALGYHMDNLPSGSFVGNQVFCQLLIMAYNCMNLFRRLCLPQQCRQHRVQGLRRMLLAIPGVVEYVGDRLTVHCSSAGPHVSLLPHLASRLREWLAPPGIAAAASPG